MKSSPMPMTKLPKTLLKKLIEAGIEEIKTHLYQRSRSGALHLADAAHRRNRRPAGSAQVAIYRMMRPGEPPTEDAVKTLFNGLFFTEDRYDLSAVGRMKFNRRVGRE